MKTKQQSIRIRGKNWDAQTIAKHCNIKLKTAQTRISLYRKGILQESQLLRVVRTASGLRGNNRVSAIGDGMQEINLSQWREKRPCLSQEKPGAAVTRGWISL